MASADLDLYQFFRSPEVLYTGLIFALFVLPRFLIRLGIPFALSAFLMGTISAFFQLGISRNEVVGLLSSLGIISLFLFAGLEVEFSELNKSRKVLIQHVAVRFLILIGGSYATMRLLGMEIRPATLLVLAVLTPSTGFILDTIDSSPLPEASKFWIRSKAIAAEIVALLMMFILIRSATVGSLVSSSLGLLALILALPLAFKFFAKIVDPVAPKSEFGFLLMTAFLAGMITKKLGAYYLVGAFIVGIAARRFESQMPLLTSFTMIKALKFFTSFFIPFYFFRAGSTLLADELSFGALGVGIALLVIFLPVRIFTVTLHRKLSLKESSKESFPVATSLLPNLVFGLVLADILRTEFLVPSYIVGGVVIYTIGTTLAPPLLMRYFWKEPVLEPLIRADTNFGAPLWLEEEPGKHGGERAGKKE